MQITILIIILIFQSGNSHLLFTVLFIYHPLSQMSGGHLDIIGKDKLGWENVNF